MKTFKIVCSSAYFMSNKQKIALMSCLFIHPKFFCLQSIHEKFEFIGIRKSRTRFEFWELKTKQNPPTMQRTNPRT